MPALKMQRGRVTEYVEPAAAAATQVFLQAHCFANGSSSMASGAQERTRSRARRYAGLNLIVAAINRGRSCLDR